MASIEKRTDSKGIISYKVSIRKKDHEIYRTFYSEEDANLFIFYKEKLINNMENFDVPISETVTCEQVMEMKIESLPQNADPRTRNNFKNSLIRLKYYFKEKIFINLISYDDWIEFANYLYSEPVYKGAKTEVGKRSMSPKTLRNVFAYISSAFSYAQSMGIPIENLPLKVIQCHISKLESKPIL